jgi:hypothetical protein
MTVDLVYFDSILPEVAPSELLFVEDSSLEFVGGGAITNNL